MFLTIYKPVPAMMKAAIAPLFASLVLLVGGLSHGEESPPEPPQLLAARIRYEQQLKTVSDPIKKQYASYLEALMKTLGAKGELAGALAVQKEIESLGLPMGSAVGGLSRNSLVIWNCNNAGKGDRGSKKINVILFGNGREQWHMSGILLKWDPNKQTKNEIQLPSVPVDKIRVEVTGLENGRGGLSEIEFIKDGNNLAKGCPVEVSAVWENNPKHVGTALTDGDPMTYWLLPDKNNGWAEISLTPKK